jgi:hypothetical protein
MLLSDQTFSGLIPKPEKDFGLTPKPNIQLIDVEQPPMLTALPNRPKPSLPIW